MIQTMHNVYARGSRISWDINFLCDILNSYQSLGPETARRTDVETVLNPPAREMFRMNILVLDSCPSPEVTESSAGVKKRPCVLSGSGCALSSRRSGEKSTKRPGNQVWGLEGMFVFGSMRTVLSWSKDSHSLFPPFFARISRKNGVDSASSGHIDHVKRSISGHWKQL